MATGSSTAFAVSSGWTVSATTDTTTSVTTYTLTSNTGVNYTVTGQGSIGYQDIIPQLSSQGYNFKLLPSGVKDAIQTAGKQSIDQANATAAAGAESSTATPVSPVTNPTANTAQSTATTDSGANAAPASGSNASTVASTTTTPITTTPTITPDTGTTPSDVPASSDNLEPVVVTSQVIPESGTSPPDVTTDEDPLQPVVAPNTPISGTTPNPVSPTQDTAAATAGGTNTLSDDVQALKADGTPVGTPWNVSSTVDPATGVVTTSSTNPGGTISGTPDQIISKLKSLENPKYPTFNAFIESVIGKVNSQANQLLQQVAPKSGSGDGTDSSPTGGSSNTNQGATANAKNQANAQAASNMQQLQDWRVRLALAPNCGYLYQAPNPGILGPLAATNGVIFPYTPDIQITYAANYETFKPVHSNYTVYQYQNSAVDQISINCTFTAQDTSEALYLLAVIHFFRSVTKMFYGQDQNPKPGTPPPLCYLYGLGTFQFNNHPLVISNFTYSLPTDVDYIRAGTLTTQPGVGNNNNTSKNSTQNTSSQRLTSNGQNIATGGGVQPVNFGISELGTTQPTYVPTMMSIQIAGYPIVTRNDVSNKFSLGPNKSGGGYASGALYAPKTGQGFW